MAPLYPQSFFEALYARREKILVFEALFLFILQRGCDFWHWELQYVMYLMEKGYLTGNSDVETFVWAEERRENLELKKKQAEERGQGHEERMMKSIGAVGEQLT